MKSSPQASISFLQRWAPNGPWALTAIHPDKKSLNTRTFRNADSVLAWLGKFGETHNIYFHVNPVTRDISKKAEREDIASLAWLHVDIDPRAGEDIGLERERALRLLREPLGNVPPPTAIVDSGGGYQGFWKLREPFKIDGKPELYEEAKRYNMQLEVVFGADNCHNVDRIMRLPGTINRPDARKRKKGRKPALAELIEWNDENVYPLAKFTPAPKAQGADGSSFGPSRSVKVSGNVPRIESVEDLPDGVSNRAKIVIVQGTDPEDPTKLPSRSEALFFVCCELVRADCSDETIFSVITDPEFRISESVLDKGSSAESYAVRQIERAREFAIDPHLAELNAKHAVIGDIGGKCRVISEVEDHAMGRSKLSLQSFDDFRNRYMNIQVVVGQNKDGMDQHKPLGAWWLQHPKRRQYDTMAFAPGREMENTYNLWRGFSCEARPGDCSLYLEHIRQNICCGNEEHYKYLLGWMARGVQKPDTPGQTAVVLRGKQGTGKGSFAKGYGSLFGRHYLQISDSKHLVGSFNAHLRDCSVLFADEAFYAGDKKHEATLKALVTEDMLAVEAKGVDVTASANCVRIIMASNSEWVVPAGLEERRFFVLDVSRDQMQNSVYFRKITEQMRNGGKEALLHFLLSYDLSVFDVRKVPQTKALQEQKMFSLSAEEEWWYRKLEDGRMLQEHDSWETRIPVDSVLFDYINYTQRFGVSRRGNSTRLGHSLRRFVPAGRIDRVQSSRPEEIRQLDGSMRTVDRPYHYVLPDLETCRNHWDENFGGPYEWPEVETEKGADEVPF